MGLPDGIDVTLEVEPESDEGSADSENGLELPEHLQSMRRRVTEAVLDARGGWTSLRWCRWRCLSGGRAPGRSPDKRSPSPDKPAFISEAEVRIRDARTPKARARARTTLGFLVFLSVWSSLRMRTCRMLAYQAKIHVSKCMGTHLDRKENRPADESRDEKVEIKRTGCSPECWVGQC